MDDLYCASFLFVCQAVNYCLEDDFWAGKPTQQFRSNILNSSYQGVDWYSNFESRQDIIDFMLKKHPAALGLGAFYDRRDSSQYIRC